MEKYSRFADPSTGCNPFLPLTASRRNRRRPLEYFFFTISIFFFLLRIPFILLCLFLLLSIHISGFLLEPFPKLQRYYRWFLSYIPLILLLFCLGVMHRQQLNADSRQVNLKAKDISYAAQASTLSFTLSHNTIVLCNHTNFIEILYLTQKFYPLFTQRCANNTLETVNWIVAAYDSLNFHHSNLNKTGRFMSLVDLWEYTKDIAPVFVFPEFSKSNGAFILSWMNEALCPKVRTKQRVAKEFVTICKERVRLAGFRYSAANSYGLPHTVHSPWKHIFYLLTQQLTYSLQFVLTSQYQIQCLLENNLDETSWSSSPENALQILRKSMPGILPGVNTVDVLGDMIIPFKEYYSSTHCLKYKPV